MSPHEPERTARSRRRRVRSPEETARRRGRLLGPRASTDVVSRIRAIERNPATRSRSPLGWPSRGKADRASSQLPLLLVSPSADAPEVAVIDGCRVGPTSARRGDETQLPATGSHPTSSSGPPTRHASSVAGAVRGVVAVGRHLVGRQPHARLARRDDPHPACAEHRIRRLQQSVHVRRPADGRRRVLPIPARGRRRLSGPGLGCRRHAAGRTDRRVPAALPLGRGRAGTAVLRTLRCLPDAHLDGGDHHGDHRLGRGARDPSRRRTMAADRRRGRRHTDGDVQHRDREPVGHGGRVGDAVRGRHGLGAQQSLAGSRGRGSRCRRRVGSRSQSTRWAALAPGTGGRPRTILGRRSQAALDSANRSLDVGGGRHHRDPRAHRPRLGSGDDQSFRRATGRTAKARRGGKRRATSGGTWPRRSVCWVGWIHPSAKRRCGWPS